MNIIKYLYYFLFVPKGFNNPLFIMSFKETEEKLQILRNNLEGIEDFPSNRYSQMPYLEIFKDWCIEDIRSLREDITLAIQIQETKISKLLKQGVRNGII